MSKDDAFEFPGDHYIVANGYDTIYENLATKAKDMGVEFRLGQEVKSIELENDKVNLSIRDLTSDNQLGWEIAKKIFPIEMNVRICIPHTIFFKILKNILIEKKAGKGHKSGGVYKVHWSISKNLRYISQKCLYLIDALPCKAAHPKYGEKIAI